MPIDETGWTHLTNFFPVIHDLMVQVMFTMFVCLYAVDFYYLSAREVQGKPVSISEAVRVSKPDSSLMLKALKSNTVTTLPGAIKSEGKKFDPDPEEKVARDPNTLPGAIDLVGSFDENSVDIVPKNEASKGGKKKAAKGNVSKTSVRKSSSETSQIASVKSSPKIKASNTTSTEGEHSSDSSEKVPTKRKKKRRKKKNSLKRKKEMVQVEKEASAAGGASGSGSKSLSKKGQELNDTSQSPSNEPTQAPGAVLYDGPHPMNRQMEELQVPAQTGILEESAVREAYGRLVKAYLKPFERGINRRSFFELLRRKTYSLTPPGANKGIQTILFQIISSSTLSTQLSGLCPRELRFRVT